MRGRGRRAFGGPEPQTPAEHRRLFEQHLRLTVLGFWERALDPHAGGFYTDLDRRGRPRGPQRRFVVHVARLVWSFSSAHRADPRDGRYMALASRAAETLDSLWDRRRGGWFQETDRWGTVTDHSKRLYGQTFGIYAMAEHALASGSDDSRRRAVEALDLLLDRGRGPHGAFATGWTEEWEPAGHPGPDTNSHIHVMEALVPLSRLTGETGHRDLLREARDLVRDRMVARTAEGGFRLVDRLDEAWREVPGVSGPVESYGHGVETAWLLLQATEALGDPAGQTLPTSAGLVDRVLDTGIDARWGGLFFRGTDPGGASDRRKVWWVQAEGLVGFLRLHRETGDPRYWRAFRDLTRWVMRRQADPTHGEWLAILHRSGVRVSDGRKSHRWKSAYHTSRACLESIRLLRELEDGAR